MAGESEIIKEFQAGQRQLSARHLNQIVHAVRQSIRVTPPLHLSENPNNIHLLVEEDRRFWIGEIDSSGQTDYSDCRYFVKKQYITNADSNETSLMTWGNETFPSDFVYTVTNLQEMSDNTHTLAEGQEVVVFRVEDDYWYRHVMSEWPIQGYHSVYDPEGSDSAFPSKSYIPGIEATGDPSNNSDYWIRGWNYIDSNTRERPWMCLDRDKIVFSDTLTNTLTNYITSDTLTTELTHYVRSDAGGWVFPVRVGQDGGSAGSDVQASFTYTVRNLAKTTTYGTGLTPKKPRPASGTLVAQASDSFGTAFYSDTSFVLWDAGETLAVSDCG